MKLYLWISLWKVILWGGLILLDWLTINVYEDTAIGIWLGIVGAFLLSWWICFFACLGVQNLFRKRQKKENDIKSSYFLSLLFSFYGIFNILLLLLGKRNKYWGVGLFFIFLVLQRIVLIDHKNQITHERNEY